MVANGAPSRSTTGRLTTEARCGAKRDLRKRSRSPIVRSPHGAEPGAPGPVRPLAPILPPTLAVLLAGCASLSQGPVKAFEFERDAVTYAILAFDTGAERLNDLVRLDGDRLLLRARDLDQDGRLDTMLVGSLALDDANAIYADGIDAARSRGRYRVRVPDRTYALRLMTGRLVVWSVAEGGSDWSNRVARIDASGSVAWTYADADADGQLDADAASSDAVPERAARAYARILDVGQRAGAVEVIGGRYRVLAPGETVR